MIIVRDDMDKTNMGIEFIALDKGLKRDIIIT